MFHYFPFNRETLKTILHFFFQRLRNFFSIIAYYHNILIV